MRNRKVTALALLSIGVVIGCWLIFQVLGVIAFVVIAVLWLVNVSDPHLRSQIIFYLTWAVLVVAETLAWSVLGLYLGFVVFGIGGAALAWYHLRATTLDGELHGPILRFTDFMFSKSIVVTFLPAVFLNGGSGVAIVLKKRGHAKVFGLAVIASFMYAAIWMTIHGLRPSAGVPVGAWPSLSVFNK